MYSDEFEYLTGAGIALNVQAISNPSFPLIETESKNLIKLYLNDVGILTGLLYGNNIQAILDDNRSINLGSVYETVVASELVAHGFPDYTVHSALNSFVSNDDYRVNHAFVFSNERKVTTKGKITYMPIYFVMCFQKGTGDNLSF